MKKLLEFQKKVGAIAKDSKNPFFKSNYFDINSLIGEIKPILNELGLVILQPIVESALGKPSVSTKIIDIETEKVLAEGIFPLPDGLDAQKIGAAITYFRRYSLQSMLFLQAEDDDGNVASGKLAGNSDVKRVCPNCNKEHQGAYPKCMDCFKNNTSKTKTLINYNAEPFFS